MKNKTLETIKSKGNVKNDTIDYNFKIKKQTLQYFKLNNTLRFDNSAQLFFDDV